MKYKKLTLVFLVIIILFLFSVNCFASSYSPYIEDLVTEEYPYYFIVQNPETKKYYLILSKVQSTEWGEREIIFGDLRANKIKIYEYSDVSWQYIDSSYYASIYNYLEGFNWYFKNGSFATNPEGLMITFYSDGSNKAIKYSNYDIKKYGEDTVFFQQTPLMGYLKVRTVATVTEEKELEKVLVQVLAILGMILVVVVSFLGLRKCLRILLMLLRQA